MCLAFATFSSAYVTLPGAQPGRELADCRAWEPVAVPRERTERLAIYETDLSLLGRSTVDSGVRIVPDATSSEYRTIGWEKTDRNMPGAFLS